MQWWKGDLDGGEKKRGEPSLRALRDRVTGGSVGSRLSLVERSTEERVGKKIGCGGYALTL